MDQIVVAPVAENAGDPPKLDSIGMLDLLKYDPRPTFVLDGTFPNDDPGISGPLTYWNPALARIHDGNLLTSIKGDNVTLIYEVQRPVRSEFHNWISTPKGTAISCIYHGYRWMKLVLSNQWIVVFGAPMEISASEGIANSEKKVLPQPIPQPMRATFDWTTEVSASRLSPHIAWARSIDWARTTLGPQSQWSSQLRSITNLIMLDPQPAVVFYSTDLIMIYNEAYIKFLGSLHPCMGLSARTALATVWSEYFEPVILQNLDGKAVEQTDLPIHMVRNGFVEETYFSSKFVPIVNADGVTVGHYEPLVETVSLRDASLFYWSNVYRILFHHRCLQVYKKTILTIRL